MERIVRTTRNIDSDCSRVHIHPDATVLMNTELAGQELRLGDDPILFYLAHPVGRNVSHGISSLLGDYIKEVTRSCRSVTRNGEADFLFR